MAKLEMSFEHGQSREVALRNFERGVDQAEQRFRAHIHSVDWGEDRQSARIRGTGYDILLVVDDRHVHAKGTIPFFARIFEAPVRRFLAETFQSQLPG